jgi:hypothetical protein
LDASRDRFWELQCQLGDVVEKMETAASDVSKALDSLDAPIEANRRRSQRNRRPKPPVNSRTQNGHRPDVRLLLTAGGFAIGCRRCGRAMQS